MNSTRLCGEFEKIKSFFTGRVEMLDEHFVEHTREIH